MNDHTAHLEAIVKHIRTLPAEFERFASHARHEQAAAAFRGAAEILRSALLPVAFESDNAGRPRCSHTWDGQIDTSSTGVTIHLSGYSGPGKLLASIGRARDLAANLDDALDRQQAEDEFREDGL